MAAQPHLRPEPGSIPTSPGVYRFRDEHGRVIYVGKAKNLRSRLSSYFQDFAALHPRTQTMVATAADVDWTVVGTEVEALQLEYSWIKEYDPRFNVRYRDDKSYPYLAITLNEEFPRVQVMRGAKRRGVRYFGPYSHAWAIRETVDLLLRVFPVRTCSAGVFRRARSSGRPCLLGYIDKCSAPCVGRVDPDEHRRLAEEFCAFMAGDTGRFIRRLEQRMREAAAGEEYERAARLRDDVQALRTALEKQAVVLGEGTDCDVIAFAEDPLEAAAQVFYVRGGRIRGQRGWVVDKVEDVDTAQLVAQFLAQTYGAAEPGDDRGAAAGTAAAIPREVLVSAEPADAEAVAAWLSEHRGGRVDLRVPQRGDKRALLETVEQNARQALARHKTQRASDLTTRSRALADIQEALDLEQAPLRIECYDVSNLQGSHVVASMVVFEDGLARKSEYRRFSIRGSGTGAAEQNDVAAMAEVMTRRFTRYLEESQRSGELANMAGAEEGDGDGRAPAPRAAEAGAEDEAAHVTPRKFAYPPNLVVVDGGRPQVQAARRALDELGIDDVAVCGLAKRLEEVWLPDEEDPVILPRTSEGLYLLQRVRDEAHRFAITYHRQRRAKALTSSALDEVPGLGPARRTALLKHFGSVRRLAAASVQEISEVPGIGARTAETIAARLAGGRDTGGAENSPDEGGRGNGG
ncbi:excinuclease ABC subunit UvrC [Marinitenerispora sediminis]|uniref:UvrABC system protein C n=1 Tax=Marinitenerispora sediminis TaxID=1931232 RepID=A0A368T2G1_9ACTN|nr:excinuclease ABC subunit UvrC [Marinitenerispora sediminis]RCV50363.1 excinuclease ABC subunit C [Marinitenerispora sediminis]RCV54228.1 excinuclease ABC subunit C [Marinitenerispora sediminis]RCV55794.1 excinuclease ABC subunit C [Marinitenerispora sediminis]